MGSFGHLMLQFCEGTTKATKLEIKQYCFEFLSCLFASPFNQEALGY